VNQLDLVELSAQDFEKLQSEMLSLIASNKKFASSLVDLVRLTENFEERHKETFGKQ
jgi:hypothetical protein